jgi:bacillithiol biosynthesis deacetylase BshB1
VDLTRGELSTRGTPETRATEAARATETLGLHSRENLGIPDGGLANTAEHRRLVIEAVRAYRPRTILLPHREDRHPDHEHAAQLVRDAAFQAGLARIRTERDGIAQTPHRPERAFAYVMTYDAPPAFIVDVSASFDAKLAAIRCYASQFHVDDASDDGPETYVSSAAFLEALIARMRRWGFLIGAEYGEGFLPLQPFGLEAGALLGRPATSDPGG